MLLVTPREERPVAMRKFLFPRIHGQDHDLCIRSMHNDVTSYNAPKELWYILRHPVVLMCAWESFAWLKYIVQSIFSHKFKIVLFCLAKPYDF